LNDISKPGSVEYSNEMQFNVSTNAIKPNLGLYFSKDQRSLKANKCQKLYFYHSIVIYSSNQHRYFFQMVD
jgi:hypothetical protein